jgi:hypothetical protein
VNHGSGEVVLVRATAEVPNDLTGAHSLGIQMSQHAPTMSIMYTTFHIGPLDSLVPIEVHDLSIAIWLPAIIYTDHTIP